MKSIYLKIKHNLDYFSKAEKRVAKYCIDNYANIGKHTLAQIAEKSGSGEATVLRFCSKLGFQSFIEFKEDISSEVSENIIFSNDSIALKIRMNILEYLDYIIKNLDVNELKKIADLIYKSDKIFCVGVGNSAIAAEACAMRFVRNGKNGLFIKDAHFQSIYVNELNNNDVVLLFSISGESKDLIHIINLIKKKNIPIISCTSSILSSIAKKSDFHILIKESKNGPFNGGSMIGQISQIFVADIMITQVGLINVDDTIDARKTTYDYIIDKMNIK